MSAKRGLGKGIDSLIPVKSEPEQTSQDIQQEGDKVMVSLSLVEPNRKQPRKSFNEDKLEELADSIKQQGVLIPLMVRHNGNMFEIIAGERRWRASKKAGLKEIPVIIRDDLTEEQIFEIQLIENIQREDLNPIEEALGYERLIKEFHMKQDEVAEKVSKSRVAITNSMRLLKLSPEVQQMVIDEKLTTGHARALISVEDPEKQIALAERIFDEKLSVREAEKIVKQLDKPVKEKAEKKKNDSLEAVYRDLEERCKNAVGTKVDIISKEDGAGKIEIEFYTPDDLEKITDRLMRG
ncbi:MAG: ParB/RepB/Spo0J family partition protein [Lachnospiraceae bacterium]|jgi:chromosome partitioning protein parB1|nr:ParB/RepB/Spo0J family partition protein [Lachnospiraceae bacterium]MBF1000468.1 ParB/RepB/Spo0J family partition protein [Lachnospiraceae bacterium]MBF1008292.1 ParB/RepB/Spo0J family partition protein [Lachnospiraceae bacterium]MBF1030348.1 ParB/RepB/Spo0J family partition protein [Lachnospiraceae bacterium]